MSHPEFITVEKIKDKLSDFVIFDIRSPMEYAREHIPSSKNVPLENLAHFDFAELRGKKALFVCRSGMRTQSAAATIAQRELGAAYCLQGGLNAWKAYSLPLIENSKAPIDIMRQVQIIAGSLVLLGVVGHFFWSKYFIALTLFVGGGLIFAGSTGFCGLAKILSYLPYNRYTPKNQDTKSCSV